MGKVIKIIQPPVDQALIAPFVDKWVALTPDRKKVIAANKNFKKLSEELDRMGIPKNGAFLQFVLKFNTNYSF